MKEERKKKKGKIKQRRRHGRLTEDHEFDENENALRAFTITPHSIIDVRRALRSVVETVKFQNNGCFFFVMVRVGTAIWSALQCDRMYDAKRLGHRDDFFSVHVTSHYIFSYDIISGHPPARVVHTYYYCFFFFLRFYGDMFIFFFCKQFC